MIVYYPSLKVVVGAETMVVIVDALTYNIKNVIRTGSTSTITMSTLYVTLDYTITG